MGIRFWCPNGHKLNVKSFQAGRRGICPYCGARFQIPTESTRRPGDQDRAPEPEEHSVHEGISGLPPAAGPSPAAAPAQGSPQAGPLAAGALAGPLDPQAYGPGEQAAQPTEPVGGSAAPTAQADVQFDAAPQAAYSSAPASPSTPVMGDPLAEAPEAVWYVRPPTGGQFGPATADVMRNWIGEGRVSPDSLVWREGWRDWLEAAGVFPQLSGNDSVPGLGNFAAPITSTTPAATASAALPAARRGRSKAANVAIILALAVAVIILLIVFVVVALGPGDKKTTPSNESGKTPVSIQLPGPAAENPERSQA